MLNSPRSLFVDKTEGAGPAWNVDRNPQFRLMLLWLVMLVPILAIIVRIGQLQLGLRDEFASAFLQTWETLEELPARDGRILAADGSVLAGDLERYDLAVYYPAIQDPPDDEWIKAKAKPRLSKLDRKDKNKLAAEKKKVLHERDVLWQQLADLAECPLNQLLEARQQEQARVERKKADVLRRYRERHSRPALTSSNSNLAADSLWSVAWGRVQQYFAEPAEDLRGPRLIREELDYHVVMTDINTEMKAELEAHPERYPYTRVLIQSRRSYPQGALASHLIGMRKPLTNEQWHARKQKFPDGDPLEYRVGDPCGMSGLELSYDSQLKGVRGRQVLVKNRRGEILETRLVRPPQHGRDLVLTLDTEVQERAEQLLDAALTKVTRTGSVDLETSAGRSPDVTCPQGGCVIALDVHTGAILAAASAPRFDLNLLVNSEFETWDEAMADPRSPFLSRATQMAIPPGSVFKIISAVASIETGKMPPDSPFPCQGYLDRPDKHRCLPFRHQGVGHGDVTLADALCRSCNVYFYTAARRMGPQSLVDWARKFGIGQATGIDLPSESGGHLPAPDVPLTAEVRRPPWRSGDELGLAIGQGSLLVTPLQMARAMAAVANDGSLVTPHLAADSAPVSLDHSSATQDLLRSRESQPIQGLHQETLDRVREGLTMVVHHPRGTGYKTVRMKEVTIAGKTGTAETNGVDHAWFAGYVPAEKPRIAFVVVIQNGGGGGSVAGPVAHQFVKKLVELGLVTKSTELVSDRVQRK